MNGELIYQSDKPISFELDKKSKKERLHKFADLVNCHYNVETLSDFLYELKIEDFYNNKTSQEYSWCGIVVPKNFKVVKSFKFFIKNDDNLLKEIQNEASRIIQEDIVSGYLCFSVHPLDFLSASENVHNWRSCHALDGEYRSGNLNYLMDNSTVICYLRAEKQAILPHFPEDVPWNSKKWRVWLYFSNDHAMLFLGRQYPFTSEIGLRYIKEQILPTLNLGEWSGFHETKLSSFVDARTGERFSFEKMVPVGETIKPLRQLVQNGHKAYMYNDVLNSSCYEPLYAFRQEDALWSWLPTGKTNSLTQFIIGKECRCPICGEGSIDFPETMACYDCSNMYDLGDIDDYYVCDICGNSVHYDDIYTLDISESQICSDCYHRETVSCQRCGATDLPDVIHYHNGKFLCEDCIQEMEAQRPPRIFI